MVIVDEHEVWQWNLGQLHLHLDGGKQRYFTYTYSQGKRNIRSIFSFKSNHFSISDSGYYFTVYACMTQENEVKFQLQLKQMSKRAEMMPGVYMNHG